MRRKTVQITNWIWQMKNEQNGIKVYIYIYILHDAFTFAIVFFFLVLLSDFYSLLLFVWWIVVLMHSVHKYWAMAQTNTVNIILTSNLSDTKLLFFYHFAFAHSDTYNLHWHLPFTTIHYHRVHFSCYFANTCTKIYADIFNSMPPYIISLLIWLLLRHLPALPQPPIYYWKTFQTQRIQITALCWRLVHLFTFFFFVYAPKSAWAFQTTNKIKDYLPQSKSFSNPVVSLSLFLSFHFVSEVESHDDNLTNEMENK